MKQSFDIEKIRKDFPILGSSLNNKPLVYLDSAATSQKPLAVIERMAEFMKTQNGTVRRGVYDLSSNSTFAFDLVRSSVQNFINAKSSNEIIFTKGTTESINLVANCLSRYFDRPITVLISELEHHANIVPWQLQTNVSIRVIPILDNGDLDLDSFYKIINSEKIDILSVTHISNVTGTINPIKEIIKFAKNQGILTVIDGAQGVTHSQVDVQDLDTDFYCFSAHKLYGPTGLGVLYGKQELLNKLPPYHGGGEMIDKVSFEGTSFAQAPFRFEAGTPPIIEVIGFGESIKYLQNLGQANISRHEDKLLEQAINRAKEIKGLKILGDPNCRASLISFYFDDIGSFDIGTLMNEFGISIRTGHHCAQPLMARFGIDSSSRISIGLYNTEEEIDLCFNALNKVIKIFRS